MSPDFDPFLEAILAQPDLRTPRLIFADYLEEQGDPRSSVLRWQALVWEKAEALEMPPTPVLADPVVLDQEPEKLRIFACLCVRLLYVETKKLLGLRRHKQRLWEFLAPSGQTAIAASELFAAQLFTENRLRRAKRAVRPLTLRGKQTYPPQAFDAAADAARFAASEARDTLPLAAMSGEEAMLHARRASGTTNLPLAVGCLQAHVRSIKELVATTPME